MLQLQNICKTYPDGTKALQNVSLSLSTGMVGLLGPNGAGKSTLMRTIATLQLADSGTIQFQHEDIANNPELMRENLGYLPQYFGVYPHMSCQALLQHIATLKGISGDKQQQQIPELLGLTNLTPHRNKKVSTFSGGMRQRFGIAQALLGDPKIIIMDEPTAGLDPMEREKLHDLLVSISKEKLVLLSTHIVEDVENLCQHVTLLFNGQIVADDQVPTLLQQIENKIWLLDESQAPVEASAILLNKQFQFGRAHYRLYCDTAPHPAAQSVSPKLQDLYFFHHNRQSHK